MTDTLHSRDQSLFDFFNQPTNSITDTQQLLRTMFIYYSYFHLLGVLFVYNALLSLRVVRAHPYSIDSWCVCVQSLGGLVVCAANIHSLMLPNGPSCYHTVLTYSVAFASFSCCSNIILLKKAYAATLRYRPFLYAGIVLSMLSPMIMLVYIIGYSDTFIADSGICLISYPATFPWVKLCIDMLINGVFSGIFLRTVLQQYRQKGSDCWRTLARDGTWSMCAVAFINIVCALIIGLSLFGSPSVLFLGVDWVVTSVLLVRHVCAVQATIQRHSHRQLPQHPLPRLRATRQAVTFTLPVDPHSDTILLTNSNGASFRYAS